MPNFVCPTCGKKLPREIMIVISHTEEHIVNEIKKKHPDWVEEDGICKKCYAYYKNQIHLK